MFLAAALTAAILMLLAMIPVSVNHAGFYASAEKAIYEENGIYDLTGLDFNTGVTAVLRFNCIYYPDVYLTPDEIETAQSVDNEYSNNNRFDYMTQHMVLEMPYPDVIYQLNFWAYTRQAYRVYANGNLVAASGRAGTTKQDTEVWENSINCAALSENGRMEIILHSAQFYHAEQGVGGATLRISAAPVEFEHRLSAVEKGFFVIGALICAAVVLLCLFLIAPSEKTTLWFSLACAVLALRECIMSGAWTKVPFLSGNTAFMLEYLSLSLTIVFLTLFLWKNWKMLYGRIIRTVVLTGSVVFGILVLVTDSLFYTSLVNYYGVLWISGIVLGLPALLWELRRPNPEQAALLYGVMVFWFCSLLDGLSYTDLLKHYLTVSNLSESSMIVFVLAQVVSLFLMNNRIVTEAREAERKLAVDKEILEGMNRLKTEFLQDIKHEIRNPLHIITLGTGILDDYLGNKQDSETERSVLRSVENEALRLGRMVNGMVELAVMSKNPTSREKISLSAMLRKCADAIRLQAEQKQNRLRLEIAPDLPFVYAETEQLERVPVNILQNAINSTQNGEIIIKAFKDKAYIAVCVNDTGEGIPPEIMPRVFERGVSGKGGKGYGLSMCQTIIEAHGGSIEIESEPGKGTGVTFTMPVYGGQSEGSRNESNSSVR